MRQTVNLNRKWAFTKEELKDPAGLPETRYWVNLPHTWNAIDGQDGGSDYDRRRCWYVKELERDELPAAEKYYLEIGGANSSAEVYVGGVKLAEHHGGYSAWRVDITQGLKESGVIAVSVDNSPREDVYPQMADFTFYGGLYRDVKLICVGESHFDLLYHGGPGMNVTPEMTGCDARVRVEAWVCGPKAELRVRCVIRDGEGRVAGMCEAAAGEKLPPVLLKNAHLWHGRKDPYLYTAEAELLKGDEVLDSVRLRFGCRSFAVDPDRGFILNGQEYPLRGVSRHQDRWGAGNALTREHHEEDMKYIMELGASTVRLAHYQHDQYFYDLCDEKGLVVWAEIPYISRHVPQGRANAVSQMTELIVQCSHHPSIAVWGLSNEITMNGAEDPDLIDAHRELNDLCHRLDPTRLTAVAALSMCDPAAEYLKIPDAVSYNHYFGWYGGDTDMNGPWFDRFHREHPDTPIGCSEYGCEALDWHTAHPVQGDYTEEYQAHYHEELIRQLFTRKYLWATHVWNMFDFGADNRAEGGENGQNHKGLMTFDRRYKKDAFYAYKAWLSDEPFVHICGKRYRDREEETTRVTVYSNQPEVELLVNGRLLGRQRSPEHFFYFNVPNQGESLLEARAGECRDSCRIRRVEKFNEAYRLKEKGAVLNWFDITSPEGFYSLNDRMSDVLRSPQAGALLADCLRQLQEGLQGGKVMGFDMTPEMMKMLGGFTVLRLTSLMGAAGVQLTKDQLLELNAGLNRIPRT